MNIELLTQAIGNFSEQMYHALKDEPSEVVVLFPNQNILALIDIDSTRKVLQFIIRMDSGNETQREYVIERYKEELL